MKQELEKELEFLLLNKSFAGLSDREQKYVLNHLTEDEYKRYHALLGNYMQSVVQDPSITPDPSIEKELLKVLRSRAKRPFLRLQRFNPMAGEFSPALTFSMFALLIFAVYFLVPLQADKQIEKGIVKKETEKKKDTITGPVQREKTVIPAQINKPKAGYSEEIPDEFPPEVTLLIRDSGEEPLCLTLDLYPLAFNIENDDTAAGLTSELFVPDSESPSSP